MKPISLAKPQKFFWTKHAEAKMGFYGLSKTRLLRVFNNPNRVEEGIAPNTVAMMQPATPKHTSEIWLMYQHDKKEGLLKIVTAWRYPAKSPVGRAIPIPEEIRRELRIMN